MGLGAGNLSLSKGNGHIPSKIGGGGPAAAAARHASLVSSTSREKIRPSMLS